MNEIIDLWNETSNISHIAKTLNITPHVVRYHLKKAGIDYKKKPLITKEQLQSYIDSNISFSEIAKKLGKSVAYISATAKRFKLRSSYSSTDIKDLPEPMSVVYYRYINGDSLDKLSKEYKRPVNTIKKKLIDAYPGIHIRTIDEAVRPQLLNDKDALFNISRHKSYTEIAKMLGVKVKTVTDAARRYGFDFPYRRIWDDVDYDTLFEMYTINLLQPSEIATRLKYPYHVILRQLRKVGFEIRKSGGQPRKSKYVQLSDDTWLKEQYVALNRSMNELAIELGTTPRNILYHLRKFNIPLKTKSEYMAILMSKVNGQTYNHKGMKCDSQLEVSFLNTLPSDSIIERNIQLSYLASTCIIDFKVGGQLYEIKPKEIFKQNGVERRRTIKQLMVCKKNNIPLTIWTKSGIWDRPITDDDIYYACNWQLFFDSPDQCTNWLLQLGFKPPKYSRIELYDYITRMNYCKVGNELNANFNNGDPLKITQHFFEHYWKSSHKGYMPVSSIWDAGNTTVLRNSIRTIWNNCKEINIYGLLKYVKKYMKDFNCVSIFKPWVAGYIYDKYLPNGGVVIDPSCGWGGRFMATIGRNIKYVGYDLNRLSIESHKEFRNFIGDRVKTEPEFIYADSSIVDFKHGDLLFTSPPYDDLEYYYGINSSITNTDTIFNNIFRHDFNIIVLNIPKNMVDRCVSAAGSKYSHVETLEMKTASMYGSREKTFEPILVFRRR